MADLLPCPVCHQPYGQISELLNRPPHAHCMSCAFTGPEADSMEDARAAWNAIPRALPPGLAEQAEQAARQIDELADADRRDLFAAAALTGLLAGDSAGELSFGRAAEYARKHGDALLTELLASEIESGDPDED